MSSASPFDLQNEIVRTSHVDQSTKAYHIPNLRLKTISEVLGAILKDPKCHLSKQKDLALYETDERFSQLKLIPGSDTVEVVMIRWGISTWYLVIKPESAPFAPPQQSAQKKVYSPKMIKDQISQYVDKTTGLYYCGPKEKEDFKQRPLSVLINTQSVNRNTYQQVKAHLETMATHERMLVFWMNQHLSKKGTYVSNLHRDVRDGVILIQLIEAVTGRQIAEYNRKPSDVQQKLQNCDLVIRLLLKLDIPMPNVRPKDIYGGNSGVIYGAIFNLCCKFGAPKRALFPKSNRKQSGIDVQIQRNIAFSVLVTPEMLAKQLEEEKQKVAQEQALASKKSSYASSDSRDPLSPRNSESRVADDEGWEEDEPDVVVPENFGIEEIKQNRAQNFGFQEREILDEQANFGGDPDLMGWEPLDEPEPVCHSPRPIPTPSAGRGVLVIPPGALNAARGRPLSPQLRNTRSLQQEPAKSRQSFDLESEIGGWKRQNDGQNQTEVDPTYLATLENRNRVLKRAESIQNRYQRATGEDNDFMELANRLKNMTASTTTISKKVGRENRHSLMDLLNQEELQQKDADEAFLSSLHLDSSGKRGTTRVKAHRLTTQQGDDYDEFGLEEIGENYEDDAVLDEFGIERPQNVPRYSRPRNYDLEEFGIRDDEASNYREHVNDDEFGDEATRASTFTPNGSDEFGLETADPYQDYQTVPHGGTGQFDIPEGYEDEYQTYGVDPYGDFPEQTTPRMSRFQASGGSGEMGEFSEQTTSSQPRMSRFQASGGSGEMDEFQFDLGNESELLSTGPPIAQTALSRQSEFHFKMQDW